MGNGVSSLIFTCRSGDRALQGDVGRVAACAAQGLNTTSAYAKTGYVGADVAEKVVKNIDKMSATSGTMGKLAAGLKWAQNHVNPIIGLSVAYKIATSDDKEKTLCTDGVGFIGMLGAESQFKKLAKTKQVVKCLSKLEKGAGSKYGKLAVALAEGIAFAATSIAGYKAASKIGEYALEADRAANARKKLVVTA